MSQTPELVFGTGNPAKLAQIQGALEPLGIVVVGIGDLADTLKVAEDGKTVQENARKKARAYAAALNRRVFSMDNALYFDGLPDNQQPGLYVRRIPSKNQRATDEELLAHYSRLIATLGEKPRAYWDFAVAIAEPGGAVRETTIKSPRRFTAQISPTVMPGYPLESIQIDPLTGQYVSEMSPQEKAQFWQRAIGEPLCAFVKANL